MIVFKHKIFHHVSLASGIEDNQYEKTFSILLNLECM